MNKTFCVLILLQGIAGEKGEQGSRGNRGPRGEPVSFLCYSQGCQRYQKYSYSYRDMFVIGFAIFFIHIHAGSL